MSKSPEQIRETKRLADKARYARLKADWDAGKDVPAYFEKKMKPRVILSKEELARERKRAYQRNYYQKIRANFEAGLDVPEFATKAFTPTGFPRGRPRIDEERTPTYHSINFARYRENNPEWKEYNRGKQAEWIAANPERAREIKQGTLARRKEREAEAKKIVDFYTK